MTYFDVVKLNSAQANILKVFES